MLFTLYCSDGLPTMYSTTTMCVKQYVLLYYTIVILLPHAAKEVKVLKVFYCIINMLIKHNSFTVIVLNSNVTSTTTTTTLFCNLKLLITSA